MVTLHFHDGGTTVLWRGRDDCADCGRHGGVTVHVRHDWPQGEQRIPGYEFSLCFVCLGRSLRAFFPVTVGLDVPSKAIDFVAFRHVARNAFAVSVRDVILGLAPAAA